MVIRHLLGSVMNLSMKLRSPCGPLGRRASAGWKRFRPVLGDEATPSDRRDGTALCTGESSTSCT